MLKWGRVVEGVTPTGVDRVRRALARAVSAGTLFVMSLARPGSPDADLRTPVVIEEQVDDDGKGSRLKKAQEPPQKERFKG